MKPIINLDDGKKKKERMLETILKINVAFTHKHSQDNDQPHNPRYA